MGIQLFSKIEFLSFLSLEQVELNQPGEPSDVGRIAQDPPYTFSLPGVNLKGRGTSSSCSSIGQ
jgi:hypothetical protein